MSKLENPIQADSMQKLSPTKISSSSTSSSILTVKNFVHNYWHIKNISLSCLSGHCIRLLGL
jgi:hypothetical protein